MMDMLSQSQLLLALCCHQMIKPYLTEGGIVCQPVEVAIFFFDLVAKGLEADLPALLFLWSIFIFVTCHINESVDTRYRHEGEEVKRRAHWTYLS